MLTTRARKRAIEEILEARFTLGAFEETRREDPPYWASPRNDMGRGIYGQAIREKRRKYSLLERLECVRLAEKVRHGDKNVAVQILRFFRRGLYVANVILEITELMQGHAPLYPALQCRWLVL